MDDTIHHFQLMNRWFLQRVEKEPPPPPPASEKGSTTTKGDGHLFWLKAYCSHHEYYGDYDLFYSNVAKRTAPGSCDEKNSVLTDLKDIIYEREEAFCLEKDFYLIGWLVLSNVCDSTKRVLDCFRGVKKWHSLHPRRSNPRKNFPTRRDKQPALDRKSPALISNSTLPVHSNAYFFERKKVSPKTRVIGEKPTREPPTGRTPKGSILLFTLRTLSFYFPSSPPSSKGTQNLATSSPSQSSEQRWVPVFNDFMPPPPPSTLISRVSSVRARS
ncbi:hypothetical protein CEXT_60091 [Caerostris extrusa]|uniref:Uncharacterized protein n=1 Tax=Caerostris extrusa TaxID=172846 RepID=A0AAV4WUX0_CAEEX|nr:hypothetical protein CEXT_60091 [Caerostris extrusa]